MIVSFQLYYFINVASFTIRLFTKWSWPAADDDVSGKNKDDNDDDDDDDDDDDAETLRMTRRCRCRYVAITY